MKDAYYFSHDSNARRDPNIQYMMLDYGWMGYGWYWGLIEILRDQKKYKFPLSRTCTLIKEFGDEIETFINECIEKYGLFVKDNEFIWSASLLHRMKERERISKVRKEMGRRGGQAKAKQLLSKSLAGKERKGKEIKEKEIKEKKVKYKDNVTMTEIEYKKLIAMIGENNTKACITKLNDYKGAKGKKYKSDYLAIRNWVINEVTGKPTSAWEMDKKKVPVCPNCGKSLKNEINIGVTHCYSCDADIRGIR